MSTSGPSLAEIQRHQDEAHADGSRCKPGTCRGAVTRTRAEHMPFPAHLPDSEVHDWLCHPNGESCPDGCDTGADASRLAAYNAFLDDRERLDNPSPILQAMERGS